MSLQTIIRLYSFVKYSALKLRYLGFFRVSFIFLLFLLSILLVSVISVSRGRFNIVLRGFNITDNILMGDMLFIESINRTLSFAQHFKVITIKFAFQELVRVFGFQRCNFMTKIFLLIVIQHQYETTDELVLKNNLTP